MTLHQKINDWSTQFNVHLRRMVAWIWRVYHLHSALAKPLRISLPISFNRNRGKNFVVKVSWTSVLGRVFPPGHVIQRPFLSFQAFLIHVKPGKKKPMLASKVWYTLEPPYLIIINKSWWPINLGVCASCAKIIRLKEASLYSDCQQNKERFDQSYVYVSCNIQWSTWLENVAHLAFHLLALNIWIFKCFFCHVSPTESTPNVLIGIISHFSFII